jgi:molybdate transport system substrate-binding protein
MTAEASGPPVQVYAAGSLREVFTAIASEHEARTGQKIVLTFGASGLLRERIEKGEPAQVFASADTDHPRRLAEQGGWQPPVVFTRNALCALTSDKLAATPATLLATMLQPSVRVGISTPKADPAGDYAWALFGKADALQSGATARLQVQGAQVDRRRRFTQATAWTRNLRLGHGPGPGGCVSDLLHERGVGAEGSATPADRGDST